ncbi:MAG: GspH/FimT family pseudopilin [Bacillota bacterium]
MRAVIRHARWNDGFSLPELLIVVAIVGIFASLGAPSFRDMIERQRIATTVNDFFAAIYLARSEAIRLGARVDLVPKDAAGDWSKGWVVFIDENGNQRPDGRERIVFSHEAARGTSIAASLTDSKVQYLAYTGSGRTRTNSSSQTTQFGSFTFKLGSQTRKIKLNFLGRPRVCNPDTDGASC